MFLMSLVLAAVTFNPMIAPQGTTARTEGYVQGQAISPDASCVPGGICASLKLTGKWNYCFFTNVYNGIVGGTPLSMEVTQTGLQGSPVYLYWVNATNKTLGIKGGTTKAHYACV